jgi:hypothetical protein
VEVMRIFGLVIYELWKRFFLHSAWKIVIILAIFCLAWGGWSAGIFVADSYTKVAAFFEPDATIKQKDSKPASLPIPKLTAEELKAKYATWDQRLSNCRINYVRTRKGNCKWLEAGFWIGAPPPGYVCNKLDNGSKLCFLREYRRRSGIECGKRYRKGKDLWCKFVNINHRNLDYLREDWRMGEPNLRARFRTEMDVR